MTRVFVADSHPDERAALRLLLMDLKMEVVGEATDWPTTLIQVSLCRTEMLLVEWNLLPSQPNLAIELLRSACPATRCLDQSSGGAPASRPVCRRGCVYQ